MGVGLGVGWPTKPIGEKHYTHKKTGISRFFCALALQAFQLHQCGVLLSGSGSHRLDLAVQTALVTSRFILVDKTFVSNAVNNRNSCSVSRFGCYQIA